MNTPLLIANLLSFLAFLLHTFQGDKELHVLQPNSQEDINFEKQEKWTLARCGWHWLSFDLFFASIGLAIINFTNYFQNENTLLQILMIYFLGYAIVWIFTIAISKSFPKNYLKLGQWILLLVLSGLIYWGIN